jgi:hypothetical protein
MLDDEAEPQKFQTAKTKAGSRRIRPDRVISEYGY